MTQTINASDFLNRQDLERFIKAEHGQSVDVNREKDIIILGKRAELEKLHLSDKTTIFGIRCRIIDTPTQDMVKIKKK